jgi:exopolyphosphatase/guanosine-5'-triphosphate,3'-diphosphate pyrophosphatase
MAADVVVAAIDLGSNSFHLAVVKVRPDLTLEPIAKEREMLRLGEVVYREGYFPDESIEAAVSTVARFSIIAERFGANVVVAKATASFRDAENTQELIDAIATKTGIDVQVISGHEEATLIFDAIRAACHLGSRPVLGVDLGGGSLELMLGDQRQLIAARSLRLGVGRLRARFGDDDGDQRVRTYLAHELNEPLSTLANYLPTRLILTSGTMNAIGRLALSLDSERDELDDGLLARLVSRQSLLGACSAILATPISDRPSLKGIDDRRAATVGFGANILMAILDAVAVDEVWLCSWALREGIVLREAASQEHFAFSVDPSELRHGSVRELLQRYRGNEAHATFVADLACRLFDDLAVLHGLSGQARERLQVAALLHDIGAFISRDNHDRHGQYLVTASPPRGFSRREIEIIAHVIGSHTKGEISIAKELDEIDVHEIKVATALVRLADALDRSHQQLIRSLRCKVHPSSLELSISATTDLGAELYALRRKRRLLESLFDRELRVAITNVGGADGPV